MSEARKGIILAGGRGERLFPITRGISKQLLPVYDKPMVYYPLCTLMRCGIRDVLVITRPDETERFGELLGDGTQWGLDISYATQPEPGGIAQALLIGAPFLGNTESFALALGDNIFCGPGFDTYLDSALDGHDGATVFVKRVENPGRYGVMAFDEDDAPAVIVEKPEIPPSDYAVTGLYFYDRQAIAMARELKPSARGEIEITDINAAYLQQRRLAALRLPDSVAWLDMGTPQGLLDASQLVAAEQRKLGVRIGVPEQVAYRNNWIDREAVARIAATYGENDYGRYLRGMIEGA